MGEDIVSGSGTRLSAKGRSGLTYNATTGATDGILADFYAIYDRAFVLANEKEEFAGFADCLRLNHGEQYDTLVERFGPFREFVATICLDDGSVVGGVNMIVLRTPQWRDIPAPLLTVNLNYVFVDAAFRNRGIFGNAVADLPDVACTLFAHTNFLSQDEEAKCRKPGGVYTFIEQNDPYRMPREDYEADTRLTGLDQIDRIGLWARKGARVIDFPYVQPALTDDQKADANLVYAVLGAPGDTLPAVLLWNHLARFFGISVMKGRPIESSPEAVSQLGSLAGMADRGEDLQLLAIADLKALPRPGSQSQHAGSLRDVLKRR